MPLIDVLTLGAVRTLADEKTFQRGLDYFHAGAVGLIDERNGALHANVQGTHRYRVVLAAADGDLQSACSCPVGQQGIFCKHAVAVALAWLESSGEEVFPPVEPGKPKKKRMTQADRIRNYLATLNENELRELLVDAADRDRRLRDKLLFAAKADAASDIGSLRAAIRQATKSSAFLDWQEAGGYAEQLDELAGLLEKRIGDGNPKLVELIEEAIGEAEAALEQIDDSEGEVYEAIRRLQEIHLLACTHLHPDPVALAERLFMYQMEGEWETYLSILPDYEDALGPEGLAHYRRLLEKEWQGLPTLAPSTQYKQHWDSRRFRVESAMEALAAQDVDAVAAVKAKDLSSPHRFLALAELYRQHERYDEALAWAEKGVAAFPGERIDNLLTFAIEEYLRRGNDDQVENIAWQRFQLQPGSAAFFQLIEVAARIGRQENLRQRALADLWKRTKAEEAKGGKPAAWQPTSRSQLLEIFLAEDDAEQAWSTLQGGPTSMQLWARAAALRGRAHPEEAIQLYFRLLPNAIKAGMGNARYEEAAAIVQAIRQLRLANGEGEKFGRELAAIRQQYKAKRNFIKALAALD